MKSRFLGFLDALRAMVLAFISTLNKSFDTLILNAVGSIEIDEAMVEGYRENVMFLSQQMSSRVWGRGRREDQAVETDFYDRIGQSDAQNATERHGDTPVNNTPHSRRAVSLEDADWGDLIDRLDRIRILQEPQGLYTRVAAMALARKKDDIAIAALLGIARSGKKGTVNVSLPNSQKLVCVAEDGTGAAPINVFALTLLGMKFDENEADEMVDENGKPIGEAGRFFCWSARQKQQLLNETKATSLDYASVKALNSGQIDTFLGFKFIRSERLPVTAAATTFDEEDGTVGSGVGDLPAGARRCIAWVGDGVVFATGIDMETEIAKRADKKFSVQVYVRQSVGASRMEEEKVVEFLVAE